MVQTEIQVRELVDKYVAYLRQNIKVKRVILFGSYANGTATKDSDIDIAIDSPDFSDNYVEDWQKLYRSVWRSGVDRIIDPRPLHPQMPSFFNDEILKTGKVVYEEH